MLRSLSNAAWVFTLLGGLPCAACGTMSPRATQPSGITSVPRENPQLSAPRGTVEAFLDPGSVREVELAQPSLGASEPGRDQQARAEAK
jgi:hypothetical protein